VGPLGRAIIFWSRQEKAGGANAAASLLLCYSLPDYFNADCVAFTAQPVFAGQFPLAVEPVDVKAKGVK
jgi:hypothetical protein